MEQVLFWLFAAVVLATALGVVVARNPLHGALSLIGSFFALAGIYVLLGAHLLAAVQILVYAGAVMVLFVFVIMLLNLKDEDLGERRVTPLKIAGGAGLGVAGLALVGRVLAHALPGGGPGSIVPSVDMATQPAFGTVEAVGRAVYTTFLLPFEVTSLLLLVAIVAAVVVARSRI
jgi:NADH-quinone oxidoreductase subunit J